MDTNSYKFNFHSLFWATDYWDVTDYETANQVSPSIFCFVCRVFLFLLGFFCMSDFYCVISAYLQWNDKCVSHLV